MKHSILIGASKAAFRLRFKAAKFIYICKEKQLLTRMNTDASAITSIASN